MIVVPIGGGGLISGIARVAKEINPTIKVRYSASRSTNDVRAATDHWSRAGGIALDEACGTRRNSYCW
jgi:threonine dehydratase